MNPWNRPSSSRAISDESLSPRSVPQNFNNFNLNCYSSALSDHVSEIPSQQHLRRGSTVPFNETWSHENGNPVRPLLRTKNLNYTGYVLGKRFNRNFLPLPPRKRRRLSEPQDPIDLDTYEDNVRESRSNIHNAFNAMESIHPQSPLLRSLPVTTIQLADLIWGTGRVTKNPYGDDRPGGGLDHPWFADMVHLLFRSLLTPMRDLGYFQRQIRQDCPEIWRGLMIATRLLTNPHTLSLFHTLIFGTVSEIEAWQPRGARPLSEDQRVTVTDALASLANHVELVFAGNDKANRSGRSFVHARRVPGSDPNTTWTQRLIREKYHLTGRLSPPLPPPYINPVLPSPFDISSHPNDACMTERMQTPNRAHWRALNKGLHATHSTNAGFQGSNVKVAVDPVLINYLHNSGGGGSGVNYGRAPQPSLEVPYHARIYVHFYLGVALVRELVVAVGMCRFSALDAAHGLDDDWLRSLSEKWEAGVFAGGLVEPLGLADGVAKPGAGWTDLFGMGMGWRRYHPRPSRRPAPWKPQHPTRGSRLSSVREHDEKMLDGTWPAGTEYMEMDLDHQPQRPEADAELRVMPFEFVFDFLHEGFWDAMECLPSPLPSPSHLAGHSNGEHGARASWWDAMEAYVRSWVATSPS
jgi:hypothetical protein